MDLTNSNISGLARNGTPWGAVNPGVTGISVGLGLRLFAMAAPGSLEPTLSAGRENTRRPTINNQHQIL